jgi:hypothetical protein
MSMAGLYNNAIRITADGMFFNCECRSLGEKIIKLKENIMRSFTEYGSERTKDQQLTKEPYSALILVRGLFKILQKLILFSCSFKNEEEEECYPERKRASCLFPGKKWVRRPFLTELRGRKKTSLFFAKMACVGFG